MNPPHILAPEHQESLDARMIQKRFLELPPSQQRCLQPFLFASHIFNMNRAQTHTHTHTRAPLAIGRVASRIIYD